MRSAFFGGTLRAAQPVIETAVLAVPPAAEELLLGLADLYARIGDRPQALSMLARLPETAATAEQWCARGALLTRLGQATAAHHALARCPTAAVGHEAAALQRLGVDPTLR